MLNHYVRACLSFLRWALLYLKYTFNTKHGFQKAGCFPGPPLFLNIDSEVEHFPYCVPLAVTKGTDFSTTVKLWEVFFLIIILPQTVFCGVVSPLIKSLREGLQKHLKVPRKRQYWTILIFACIMYLWRTLLAVKKQVKNTIQTTHTTTEPTPQRQVQVCAVWPMRSV